MLTFNEHQQNHIRTQNLADYLHVNRKRIQKIVSRKLFGHSFSETGGRPERIDEIGRDKISNTIKTATRQRKPLKV